MSWIGGDIENLQWHLISIAGLMIGATLLLRHVVIFALETATDIIKKARECREELRKEKKAEWPKQARLWFEYVEDLESPNAQLKRPHDP